MANRLEYTIIESENPATLKGVVDRYLASGWELAGGVCVTPELPGRIDQYDGSRHKTTPRTYYQAMWTEHVKDGASPPADA